MAKHRNYSVIGSIDGINYEKEHFDQIWEVSPRVNGRLVLQSNPFARVHYKNNSMETFTRTEGFSTPALSLGPWAESDSAIMRARTLAYNQAYARFRGKLHKGGASMGVTIASWKQSRDMIVDRSKKIGKVIDRISGQATKRKRESAASAFLEGEFGWRPLLADIHATLKTACQQAIPPAFVGGVGEEAFRNSLVDSHYRSSMSGTARCHVGALVDIENPNLWLANRLGLINPATVIWDLVPWSFVVNMFVNVNAVVGSFTDFIGLNIRNESVTTRVQFSGEDFTTSTYPPEHPFWSWGKSSYTRTVKSRTVGDIPSPQLTFKIPDLNWELALIATSLLVQKSQTLTRLLSR